MTKFMYVIDNKILYAKDLICLCYSLLSSGSGLAAAAAPGLKNAIREGRRVMSLICAKRLEVFGLTAEGAGLCRAPKP